jgi:hypothetical protein
MPETQQIPMVHADPHAKRRLDVWAAVQGDRVNAVNQRLGPNSRKYVPKCKTPKRPKMQIHIEYVACTTDTQNRNLAGEGFGLGTIVRIEGGVRKWKHDVPYEH